MRSEDDEHLVGCADARISRNDFMDAFEKA